MEKIWLGYLTTLLLSAPIPSRMFINYAHQMPAGQRHESYYVAKGQQVCPLLQPHGISKGQQVCPLLQPHGISKGEQVCVFYYSRTVFPRASRCALYYSRTAFPRASRCVFYYSRTIFTRASRCVFYYSRFAAGGFLAASLVMEPSCSALMAASPPGPADARIGLIGTASQQPA